MGEELALAAPTTDPVGAAEPNGWQRPVCAASAAVFRIAFGVAMIVNAALYVPVLVREYYIEPSFSFSYGWFTWVTPLPVVGMYAVYFGMIVTGALIALGRWYRPAVACFFLLTTYVFLLDSSYFQNHEYLVSLLALLMLVMPLDGYWSLDAARHPERQRSTVAVWVVWMLRFQVGVPYVYGGLAKLNGDWFVGEPLRSWLAARTEIEPIATVLSTEVVVWFMNHGALVLDLSAVPLLLWRRTRLPVFCVLVGFHVTNAWLFGLFIFPWLMIAATTIFFEPDWPLRVWTKWTGRTTPAADTAATRGARHPRLLGGFLLVWVVIQLLVPFRHHLIDGDVNWTEEGHRYAWHMKLRAKSGTVSFVVGEGRDVIEVDPRDHLGEVQVRRLSGHPQRLAQFAHHLSGLYDGAPVRAITAESLNGRPRQPIVDPERDLSQVPTVWFGHQDWILRLEQELPK